ncbi:ABC transporter ATP-binding protein [Corynebacterium halotolerans]|uniref:ABC transporter ATP-binding protein n=1 Tax=Corynebacterium halotolerans TaxID=225326 RepID=UPI003CF5D054
MEPSINDPTVVVRKIYKDYRVVGHRKQKVRALSGVTFAAYSGDSIGVLGKNGSGKSTLLRLIAGGEAATSGEIKVSSQPTLLGVSAALQPRLSGAQNIRLGLLAMGLTPDQVDEKFQEIRDFSDIGDAIHRPMNTYSSGMGARLKFAISTSVRPEILLIDEALSTGDASFTDRARKRMDHMLESSGTVFLVSHGAATIQEACTRALWLHEGRIIADGEAESVTKSYRVWGNRKATGRDLEAQQIISKMEQYYTPPRINLLSEQENRR